MKRATGTLLTDTTATAAFVLDRPVDCSVTVSRNSSSVGVDGAVKVGSSAESESLSLNVTVGPRCWVQR